METTLEIQVMDLLVGRDDSLRFPISKVGDCSEAETSADSQEERNLIDKKNISGQIDFFMEV